VSNKDNKDVLSNLSLWTQLHKKPTVNTLECQT